MLIPTTGAEEEVIPEPVPVLGLLFSTLLIVGSALAVDSGAAAVDDDEEAAEAECGVTVDDFGDAVTVAATEDCVAIGIFGWGFCLIDPLTVGVGVGVDVAADTGVEGVR